MFDYVHCEMPLPDGWTPPSGELQTKSLDCCMIHYKITSEGRLLEKLGSGAFADDELPPMSPQYRDVDHHGWIEFYGSEPRPQGAKYIRDSQWWDDAGNNLGRYRSHTYRAKFTDGTVVAIEVQAD